MGLFLIYYLYKSNVYIGIVVLVNFILWSKTKDYVMNFKVLYIIFCFLSLKILQLLKAIIKSIKEYNYVLLNKK